MLSIYTNSFTNTPGAGRELSFRAPNFVEENNSWISTYRDFIKKINEQKDKRGSGNVKEKIETLRGYLQEKFSTEVDPIAYLNFLYYREGLSLSDIHKRIGSIIGYKDRNGLRYLFTNVFGWDLREKSGSENTRKKREGSLENARSKYDKIIESKYTTLVDYILLKTENIIVNCFDYNYFISQKKRIDKILYLLEVLFGVTRDDIIYVNNEYSIGPVVISNFFNLKIKSFLEVYGIEMTFYPRDISEILKKKD